MASVFMDLIVISDLIHTVISVMHFTSGETVVDNCFERT